RNAFLLSIKSLHIFNLQQIRAIFW
ncbi:hypothetical protein N499_0245B, partial [Wolbachia pipientis wVitA]